jgi:hypothetical protein
VVRYLTCPFTPNASGLKPRTRRKLSPSLDLQRADMSAHGSTFTTPVACRMRPSEYKRLRALAHARGTTVSALLAGLARRELQAA